MVDDSQSSALSARKGVERQHGMGSKISLIFLPARWVKHLAAHREATSRPVVRSFLGCDSVRAHTFFELADAGQSVRPHWVQSTSRKTPRILGKISPLGPVSYAGRRRQSGFYEVARYDSARG